MAIKYRGRWICEKCGDSWLTEWFANNCAHYSPDEKNLLKISDFITVNVKYIDDD